MTRTTHHLAQANIARMKAPLDDPLMAGFVEGLDVLNALADASDGFVWRLQTEEGDATDIGVGGDPTLLVNVSVWESLEALRTYAYEGEHARYLRGRREWFEPIAEASLVLWWVPRDHRPTEEEAMERLALLGEVGPSARAFTFAKSFPPPRAG